MASLYCHPWVGEFGWELCWWNPMARYYSDQGYSVSIAAPESSRYLYEFVDVFVPIKAKGLTYWEGELDGESPIVPANFCFYPWIEFARYEHEPEKMSTKRLWRNLSPESPEYVADILCAFRPQKYIRSKKIHGKEYPITQCQQLVDALISRGLSVACFGGLDNHCPNGTIDLRGKPLEDQCSAIAAAKCVIGPSSGPIHLASLCGCPHITWIASIHHTLEQRYKKLWNPFNTPVEFVCNGRIPSLNEIMQRVDVLLNN